MWWILMFQVTYNFYSSLIMMYLIPFTQKRPDLDVLRTYTIHDTVYGFTWDYPVNEEIANST